MTRRITLAGLFLLNSLFAFSAIGSEVDTQSFFYTGSRGDHQVELRTQIPFNYNVNASVKFNFTPPRVNDGETVNMEFKANLNRDQLSVSAIDYSDDRLVVLSEKRVSRSQVGGELTLQENHQISFQRASMFFSPVLGSMYPVYMGGGILSVRMPTVYNRSDLVVVLRVRSYSQLLFFRPLNSYEYTLVDQSARSATDINFQLSALLGSNYWRYRGAQLAFDVQIGIRTNKDILNSAQFERWSNTKSFFAILN